MAREGLLLLLLIPMRALTHIIRKSGQMEVCREKVEVSPGEIPLSQVRIKKGLLHCPDPPFYLIFGGKRLLRVLRSACEGARVWDWVSCRVTPHSWALVNKLGRE